MVSLCIILIVYFDFFRVKGTGVPIELDLEEVRNASEYKVVRTGWRELPSFDAAKEFMEMLAADEEKRANFFAVEAKVEDGSTARLFIRGTQFTTTLPFMRFTDSVSYSPFIIVEVNSTMYIFEVVEDRSARLRKD